jgi:hypothetical protein
MANEDDDELEAEAAGTGDIGDDGGDGKDTEEGSAGSDEDGAVGEEEKDKGDWSFSSKCSTFLFNSCTTFTKPSYSRLSTQTFEHL